MLLADLAIVCPFTPFSTACLVILHCLAMSSSLNPPPSCWTVDWTPPLSSTSCPFLSCTGASAACPLFIQSLSYGWWAGKKFFVFFNEIFSLVPHQSKTLKATWVGLQGRNIKLGKGTWSVSFHPCVYEVHILWLCLGQRAVNRKTCHLCSYLQELKECAGRVFVDSQPEFCLPEVRPPITNIIICFVLFVLSSYNFGRKTLVSGVKSYQMAVWLLIKLEITEVKIFPTNIGHRENCWICLLLMSSWSPTTIVWWPCPTSLSTQASLGQCTLLSPPCRSAGKEIQNKKPTAACFCINFIRFWNCFCRFTPTKEVMFLFCYTSSLK